ncbi:hypothetical protein GCM10011581_26120 [Saccharopolyspora subtropica]|uniref:DUF1015 family protein n=1 Tax=Saccharopolyspora thermophila TaxID=89367 RepID=A0A917NDP9_9PSEU|nr:DUF1015 family protein [Saccharopolyspora subtropica]GGI87822.1 hypothetical protein GCM10011581_26120 [Saccharopolyspora subtropica]
MSTTPALDRRGITTRPPRAQVRTTSGQYARLPSPAVVVYRMETGRHRQTGVVLEVSLDDYRTGRIRCHEATQPDRERELEELTEATGIEQMPVMLVHRRHPLLRAQLAEITTTDPDVRLTTGEVTHSVWIRRDAERARAVNFEVSRIHALYIADGHHRMRVAGRYADRHRDLGPTHPAAYTLAALFPADEMRILGYHRCVPVPPDGEVLRQLATHPATMRIEAAAAPEAAPGVIAVRLDEQWYRLHLRTRRDPYHGLDARVLDEELLPELAVDGHHNVDTCWCATHRTIHFAPHPPSIDQLMSTSDAGLVMPAKSTWFDPKPAPNLFRRRLR